MDQRGDDLVFSLRFDWHHCWWSVRVSSAGQCPRTPAVGARWRAQTAGSCCGCPSEDTLASLHRIATARATRSPRRREAPGALAPPSQRALIPPSWRACRAWLGPLCAGGAMGVEQNSSCASEAPGEVLPSGQTQWEVGGGPRRPLCKASARRRPATERSEGALLGAPTKRA
jgi:hypothetical protein